MDFLLLGLILLAMPVVGWVSSRRLRKRVTALEEVVLRQAGELDRLTARLDLLARAAPATSAAPPQASEAAEPERESRTEPVAAPIPDAPALWVPAPPPAPARETPLSEPAYIPGAAPIPAEIPATHERLEPVALDAPLPAPHEAVPPEVPVPPVVSAPPSPPFDWESLIGVKLFAGIAGVALVLAAVFFLRYSIDQGWLQPPVRVAIGILVSLTLLLLCELKSAREYPATANALDGAAIAILFATFFAAHALWNLFPASVTFVLMAVVTALAVLLSIRRESLFIAVLGLLGGFATPALLSTGANRPIPLFAYLLLLNVGLAWVAYRQVWPVLTWLTVGLTTLYQLVWVGRFLDESNLSIAMGIFLVFPLTAAAGLLLGGAHEETADRPGARRSFERTAMLSAIVPLVFAGYLASVPAYGAHAWLLLGFLLLVDAGLLAISVARRLPDLHAAGALTTIVVLAVWLATSYVPGEGWHAALVLTPAFVLLYLGALPLARWFGRPFDTRGGGISLAGSLFLFVFPVLPAIEPAVVEPVPLFLVLLGLLIGIGWRAVAESRGALFYVASFFAVAAQAVWSGAHLTEERLGTAVAIYTAFGVVSTAVPALARRAGRPLEPLWAGGAVLLASLLLLGFVSLGPVSAAALWALAFLLAIMNAGLFIESASGGLPLISQAGSLISWALLSLWWSRAAGSVGVLASLAVMTGLTLVTLAGHAWAGRRARLGDVSAPASASFGQGLYLGLVGHMFLILIAGNREWSLPPWPLFGALAAMTLATSAASLLTRTSSLHAAGVVGAALVVTSWAGAAGSPAWGLTVVIASAVVSTFSIAWVYIGGEPAARAAAVVLFVGELSVLNAAAAGAPAPFPAQLSSHVLHITAVLVLTARYGWRHIAIAAVAPAWMAVAQRQALPAAEWQSVLLIAGTLYALFVVYALARGARVPADRDPYSAAVLASAMFFVGGRHAFEAGGLGSAVGAVPVAVAAVLALLLRNLLRIEAEGERDIGRLALVAGAALGFVTIAIPLQLDHQWITIGWALEGAALAWLYRRIPHRGLFYGATGLLSAVFVRLALNPEILLYEPRGSMRIFNWYLYAYLICAMAMFAAAWWLSGTGDHLVQGLPRASALLPGAGVILLFLLLNIEIADYYSTGPTIAFRFGTTVSQDLTYTIGWLAFGMLLLAAGIYAQNRAARITAVALIAVTTLKCFLYDLASLGGLYRVGSFVGLAFSLALVSLALKKYALPRAKEP